MLLRPLDIVVAVAASVRSNPRWTMAEMAEYLGVSEAQVYRAARRALAASLLTADRSAHSAPYRPSRATLVEFLIHGVKYMVVPARGGMTRGIPTSHAAPILAKRIAAGKDPVPVWATPDGKVRGESFEPVHSCVPFAAARDARFYDVMALLDAIRGGRARERSIAAKLLPEVLGG